MDVATVRQMTFLTKVFLFCLAIGLVAGGFFPFITSLFFGSAAGNPAFIATCFGLGIILGLTIYLFVRDALQRQLRRQLDLLRPICSDITLEGGTVEGLERAVKASVVQVETLLGQILAIVDNLVPHFGALSESGRFLSERTKVGLAAASQNRDELKAMKEKQEGVMTQIRGLSDRSQEEAAISRELSASLEETAEAMDHSTAKFLETTASVDEMVSSLREVSSRSEEIAGSVEAKARDLDAFAEALNAIRHGVSASANSANAVREDAQNGIAVVNSSMEEMERIEQDSREAMVAMERLSGQTSEVVKIIEVIKELVSDTELLAFNAAILAAQAGEEGKGFAVVADEIRDLADRTTTSAQEIHRIVEAISEDTGAVTTAVERTGKRIIRGRDLSRSTGEALRKILDSAEEAAKASGEISDLTAKEGERAGSLLDDAGKSLRSVKAVARAIQEQQNAIARIQEGVTQMKAAADQIARGMEEQVRANQEFDRGLMEREEQVQAIRDATQFQLESVERIFSHFASSEERLRNNSDRTILINTEIDGMKELTERLRKLAADYGAATGNSPGAEA